MLEDSHWLDALSHDLLDWLAGGLADLPVAIVLAYRPPELQRLQAPRVEAPRVEALSHFTRLSRRALSAVEAEQAIRAKLAQLFPARGGSVPPALVERLMEKAQGNLFYLEELLNYLRDHGLNSRDPGALKQIELPESLHTLILSRLDRLTAPEQLTIKVASVIGRVFPVAWLLDYEPLLGEPVAVQATLEALWALDPTPLDTPERELAYREGQIEWALALGSLARRHPAADSQIERAIGTTLAKWQLDPAVEAAGLAQGAALDWEQTLQELLKDNAG